MSAPLLSLVLPMYNEEDVATTVALAILKVFQTGSEPLQLVLVDNGSTDGTGAAIDELARQWPSVLKVRVDVNQGYGWGILCGMKAATGSHLGFMGGDGQIKAADVLRVWRRMQQGDVAVAKTRRMVRKDGPIRRVVTFLCNSLFSLLFPVRTHDINGTPKIFTRDVYNSLALVSKDWFIDAEVMIKCGRRRLSFAEVPVTFEARVGGISHVRFSAITEFLRNIARALLGGLR